MASNPPKPYSKASEQLDYGVGMEIRGTWWRVNADGDLEEWADNPAAELEQCRAERDWMYNLFSHLYGREENRKEAFEKIVGTIKEACAKRDAALARLVAVEALADEFDRQDCVGGAAFLDKLREALK